ncbi:hypothetical protein [Porphyromonas crevioricanis]|uniref:hypothetical protein n=1 Tax=Porphyromonas crevioricanis TaxID=393921 RepID=UPI000412CB57|nr:hypothetical protein [Porphyromonas crevioricanis]
MLLLSFLLLHPEIKLHIHLSHEWYRGAVPYHQDDGDSHYDSAAQYYTTLS